MSKKNLVLIGGGGHCKSVIEAIHTDEHIDIIGILDSKDIHTKILNVPVIGDDTIINDLINQHYQFLITVGNIGSPATRIKLFDHIKSLHGFMATIIAHNAIVSKSSQIGEGTVILQKALVNAEVKIGNNCIINSCALIEHESVIGNHVHIATGAIVNGQCRIGNNVFVGSGAIVANNVTIADNVVIGAGSLVIHDIVEAGTYFGQPAILQSNK
jgi:sugar O-acyltransferase (sialic acid O-acetyltransferase NeuD family)